MSEDKPTGNGSHTVESDTSSGDEAGDPEVIGNLLADCDDEEEEEEVQVCVSFPGVIT